MNGLEVTKLIALTVVLFAVLHVEVHFHKQRTIGVRFLEEFIQAKTIILKTTTKLTILTTFVYWSGLVELPSARPHE